ncbi:MAG: hypothetical protein RIR66_1035 [Actinomycetota bacterium]
MTTIEVLAAVVLLLALATLIRYNLPSRINQNQTEVKNTSRISALRDVIEYLPGAAMILDSREQVIAFSANCVPMGLVADDRLLIVEIRELNQKMRRKGEAVSLDDLLIKTNSTMPNWEASVQISPIDHEYSLVLARDLSEERRLNAVRRDFVANVSHELKTPVGALSLLAEAIAAAGNDTEQINKFSSRMQLEVKRLTEMITDLVELSEVQGEKPMQNVEPVRVDAVINEAVDTNKLIALENKISISVAENLDQVCVLGDQRQLVTALANLISNAIRYSPANTHVGVGSKVVGDQVEISVTDQGVGISEADQIRIFERFYRVDPARSRETGGTGLGLAIVKHISANHGGECSVWSRPGEGSTFTLKFPICASDAVGVGV